MKTDTQSGRQPAVSWFEPAWSYRPRMKAELSELFRWKMWLRVVTIVILLTIVMAISLKRLVPELEFNYGGALVKSIGACVLILAVAAGLCWYLPPSIRINDKGISRQHGNTVHWRERSGIRRIIVDATDRAQSCLQIESQRTPWRIGLAREPDPTQLVAFLRKTFPELLVEEKR